MNALSHFYTDISPRGFTLEVSPQSSRLLALTFDEATVAAFREATAEWPVQALEYKSMLRFRVAKILDDLCANTLQVLERCGAFKHKAVRERFVEAGLIDPDHRR